MSVDDGGGERKDNGKEGMMMIMTKMMTMCHDSQS
jgi:hypothetical protein